MIEITRINEINRTSLQFKINCLSYFFIYQFNEKVKEELKNKLGCLIMKLLMTKYLEK